MTEQRYAALEAYRRYREEHSDLPTIGQIANMSGIDRTTTRRAIHDAGLPWQPVRAGERADQRQRRLATAEKLVSTHARLSDQLGRPPMLSELASEADMSQGGYFKKLVTGLGLKCSHRDACREERSRRRGEEQRAGTPFEYGRNRATARLEKIYEIRQSGNPEASNSSITERAGMTYSAQSRVYITCPVCGTRRLIAPRMHPWWLRNAAGEVIFVCRDACAGRSA